MAKVYVMSISEYNEPTTYKAFTSSEKAMDYLISKNKEIEDLSTYVEHRPNDRIKVDIEAHGFVRTLCHRLKGGFGVWCRAGDTVVNISAVNLNPPAHDSFSDIL